MIPRFTLCRYPIWFYIVILVIVRWVTFRLRKPGKGAQVNLEMLKNALNQLGHWKDQGLSIDKEWLQNNLNQKLIQ